MYMINTIPYGKCFVRYLHTRFCIRNLTNNVSMYVSLHGHFRLTCEQANLKEIIGERKWTRRYFFADTHRSLVIYHVLWLLLSHGWAQEPLGLLIGSIKTGDVYHLHGRANLSVHGAWANGKQKFRRLYYFHQSVAWTERRPWRTGAGVKDVFEEAEHEFPFGIIRPEKQEYLFRCSVAPGNFPLERLKKSCCISRLSKRLFVNGKQPKGSV